MKRLEFWKLIPPCVDYIDEDFHTAVYADGGSINVKFLVGTRKYSLWARADRFHERRGYVYQYTGHIYLNGWRLDGRVKTLENLIVAIQDYLNRDLDEEARRQEEAYFQSQVYPKSEQGNQRVELKFALGDLERAKRPGCIHKRKALTKNERAKMLEELAVQWGNENQNAS